MRRDTKWLPAVLFAGAMTLAPVIANSSGHIFYHTYLTTSINVTAGPGHLSVARSLESDGTSSSNTFSINSQGSTPYILFFDQGLNATGSQRNLRGNAGLTAYKLCQDPACATVWAPNGDPTTGQLVAPGSAPTKLPVTVIRAVNAADDGSFGDVVTLMMYF